MRIEGEQVNDSIRILLVDNEPERLQGLAALLAGQANVMVRDPFDVDADDLAGIDLVSVDEFLGDEWEAESNDGRFSEPASISNQDGLAVAAAFRSQSRSRANSFASMFAVTLHTGELARLAEGLPRSRWEPLTAAQHDLEWVFEWGQQSLAQRLLSLARAVRGARHWQSVRVDALASEWLQAPALSWVVTAQAQLEDCRPPASGLAANTSGRSLVRWLSQRVLPYPTFLLDEHHAANLLGITADSFYRLMSSEFGRTYAAEYCGPLHDFLGTRWWRAGIQQILVDAGREQWDDAEERCAQLAELSGLELRPLINEQPVVTYSALGQVASIDGDPQACVRMQIDGWPVFADDPWVPIETAIADPAVRALVAFDDRDRVKDQDA